jgi:hypothetical protein
VSKLASATIELKWIGFGVIYDKNLKKYIIDIIYDDEKKRIKSFKDYYLFKDI